MRVRTIARRAPLLSAVPLAFAVAACASSSAVSRETGAAHAITASHVVIPGADRFSPFVTVVQHGSRVTFHNGDHDAHSVVSIPGDPRAFDRTLQPGESWTISLPQAGAYRYYCSIHAQYDPSTGQVRALPRADHPDEPMEGVLLVKS